MLSAVWSGRYNSQPHNATSPQRRRKLKVRKASEQEERETASLELALFEMDEAALDRDGSRVCTVTYAKLAEQMRGAAPHYFLNVPQLLERMRKAVDEQLWKAGGLPLAIYSRAKSAYMRAREGKKSFSDSIWLGLANAIIFPAIRKKMIGAKLKALICGSAPLNVETQLFFMMIGIPILQVYGLTETTAICTMDLPGSFEPGRVGPAIAGVEMKLSENQEILVRGPNIFPGYWNRPEETQKALRDQESDHPWLRA